MNKRLLAGSSFLVLLALISGCSSGTPEQQVKQQIDKVHALTDTERALAQANAKKFYERPWPTSVEGKGKIDGTFIECRPSDSNFNGFVTCTGFVPNKDTAQLEEKKRYCGYKPELVGCSDEDTVK